MTSGRIALALAGAAAIVLGAALIIPAATRPRAALPSVGANELIASIRDARPGPLAGTVRLDERLGLAGLTGMSRSPAGARSARLWTDGAGRRRISLPAPGGERTIVNDGSTVWSWDSATRSVTRTPAGPADAHGLDRLGQLGRFGGGELMGSPSDAASALLSMLEPSSTVRVEPAAVVADRPSYQLVLDPLPTERTLLREVRVAVDAQTRLPLQVTVLANGSADPALQIGFSSVSFGPQNPALFGFAPAPGVTIHTLAHRAPSNATGTTATPPRHTVIGQGWDTVVVNRVATPLGAGSPLNRPPANRLSTPISGTWGRGRLVSTPIGNAVLTSDGRMAAGAVPAQVLTEALSR